MYSDTEKISKVFKVTGFKKFNIYTSLLILKLTLGLMYLEDN